MVTYAARAASLAEKPTVGRKAPMYRRALSQSFSAHSSSRVQKSM